MSGVQQRELLLSVCPFTRGIAFTLFEGPLSPIDWGLKEVRGGQKNARTLEATKRLINGLHPDILVLEEFTGRHERRARRIRRLQSLIKSYAEGQAIEVHRYPRETVRKCFKDVGASTRYEIAQAIASKIHAFGHRLPPVRKIWKSEDARMSLFDAASLAMTFYCENGETPTEDA